jgi:hypothetical protein
MALDDPSPRRNSYRTIDATAIMAEQIERLQADNTRLWSAVQRLMGPAASVDRVIEYVQEHA